jgi:hypothetical protein
VQSARRRASRQERECESCGDKADVDVMVVGQTQWRHWCVECAAELFDGRVYIPEMNHDGYGHPNGRVESATQDYHGGRFHSGGW